jgi:hypothetical protein
MFDSTAKVQGGSSRPPARSLTSASEPWIYASAMSDANHASGAHESHSAHAHDVYEGTPADTIPPDEPHTPGWLPIVGIGLTLGAILLFALRHEDTPSAAAAPSPQAAAEAAPAPANAPPPRPARPEGSAPARLPGLPGIPSAFMRPRPGASALPLQPGVRAPGAPAGTGPRPVRRPEGLPPGHP